MDYQPPLEQVSEYELLRTLESTSEREPLALALAERDQRLRTRAYSRNFWSDVFAQETRRLRDNLGGEFVTVKRGSYVVGSYSAPHVSVRRVEIAEPYSIGRFPVTERAYKRFVDDYGYDDPVYWDEVGWQWRTWHSVNGPWLWARYPYTPARGGLPMAGVSYFEAVAYCRWRSGRTTGAAEIRLPTALEWECAARGRLGRAYPWGWVRDGSRANLAGARYPVRTPVNRHPGGVSPTGCWDCVGNVAELSADPRPAERESYERVVASLRDNDSVRQARLAFDLLPATLRVHGGSFSDRWAEARLGNTRHGVPDERLPNVGFRVVRTPAIE